MKKLPFFCPQKCRRAKNIKIERRKGFTIIEIVLVLATAGLIFAMVFIGLPALKRSQRNSQRKRDVERVYSAVMEYYANNGHMPYTAKTSGSSRIANIKLDQDFVPRYVDSSCTVRSNWSDGVYVYFQDCSDAFTSPSGSIYTLCTVGNVETGRGASSYATNSCSFNDESMSKIEIRAYSDCDDSENKYKLNNFSVKIRLEGGAYYCVDNS